MNAESLITVSHEGQQYGPYPIDQIRQHITQGTFNSNTLFWDQKSNSWRPVQELLVPVTPAPSFVQAVQSSDETDFQKRTRTSQERIADSAIGVGCLIFSIPLIWWGWSLLSSWQSNVGVDAGGKTVLFIPYEIFKPIMSGIVFALGVTLFGYGFYYIYKAIMFKFVCKKCKSLVKEDQVSCAGCAKLAEHRAKYEAIVGR